MNKFRSHLKRVRDPLSEVEALSDVLFPLVDLLKPDSDVDLSSLDPPLIRCGNVCTEV